MGPFRARSAAAARFADNPFYVLGVRPPAAPMGIERAFQTLPRLLGPGLARATAYPTPVGVEMRTADKVRHAVAELRDPERRLGHELWARLDPADVEAEPHEAADDRDGPDAIAPWPEALAATGWRHR